MKAYVAETSCSQLWIDFAMYVQYMLKINSLVSNNVATSLYDIMHVDVCLVSMFSAYLYVRTYVRI